MMITTIYGINLLIYKYIPPFIGEAIKNDPELDHNFSGILCTHYGELNQKRLTIVKHQINIIQHSLHNYIIVPIVKSNFSCMKCRKLWDSHFDCLFTSFASYF